MLTKTLSSLKSISLHKLFYVIASLFFFTIFLFSIHYFKERTLYIDSAFQFFKIINTENFNFEAHRYGVVFTQILPLTAIKLGLSIKYILLIFSVSFVLINYFIFLFCYHTLKEKSVSFIIPASLIIGISHGFFYTVTEIYQAIGFIVLFYSWINQRFKEKDSLKINLFNFPIALLIFLQAFFCHPLAIFPALFIIGYHCIQNNKWEKEILSLIPFIIITGILKILFTETSGYEGNLFENFANSPSLLSEIWLSYPFNLFLKKILFDLYTIPFILFSIIIAHYFYHKKFLLLAYLIGSVFTYWIILSLTFFQGDDDIAMEKTFSSLFLLILIPISKEIVFRNENLKLFKAAIFLGIIGIGLNFIHEAGKIYKGRITYLEYLLKSTNPSACNKFIVSSHALDERIRIPWALSVETLLLSALKNPENQTTIYAESNKKDLATIDLNATDQFLWVPFSTIMNEPLNSNYFHLEPCKYTYLQKNSLDIKKIRIIKNYDFNKTENIVFMKDSTGIEEKCVFINKNREYALTFESTIRQITLQNDPVFLINIQALVKEELIENNLFLVISLENEGELIYYKRLDLQNKILTNEWTTFSNRVDLYFAEPDCKLKIYLWNPQQQEFYISKMNIALGEI